MNGEIRTPFWSRHRGPFQLVATRPHAKKPAFSKCEWLKGEIRNGDDAESEARALLADPRDTIIHIHVWSLSEECFVSGYSATHQTEETRNDDGNL